jgi:hypothetical protein
MLIAWIALYAVAVAMLFISGGGISTQAIMDVPLLFPEGFIKVDSILFFVAMVFFFGPLFVIDSIIEYSSRRTL